MEIAGIIEQKLDVKFLRPKSKPCDLGFGIWDFGFGILGVQVDEFTLRKLQSEIRNPKSQILMCGNAKMTFNN
jgi:hypothetical protein